MSKIDRTNFSIIVTLLSLTLLSAPGAYGQQTTEQFIPIGHSPGISDEYSYIGKIVAVDTITHSIVVESNRGTRTILVTPDTRIWLDRSKRKRTSTVGSYANCEVGRKVEVMHDHDDENVAAWIKIESR